VRLAQVEVAMIRLLSAALLIVPLAAASQNVDSSSPAQRRIEEAWRQIEAKPDNASAHAALAHALARRARETADPEHYAKAEEAVTAALALEPQHLEARKTRIWIKLGKHEFAAALADAEALNAAVPDDVQVYGYLVDANAELGRYQAAEHNAQWMLDLRPGNIPALTRAAYLREIFGDVEGAIEMMQLAYQRTPLTEVEDRAWIATHLAHLELARGRAGDADKLAGHALELFPDYHYALAQLAKVRMAQGRRDEAVTLLRRHVAAAPHPENFYGLGVALLKAGKQREARQVLSAFETKARAEMQGWDNANRELVMYYVEQARQPATALEVARIEAARRQDVYTLDALAWALSASGRHGEARTAMDKALAVGIRDAAMLYRAGQIAMRQSDARAALEYFERSLAADPGSEYADAARRSSTQLRAPPARSAQIPVKASVSK
jgi:tetratricopeptide (TPR) repeat protein